MKTSFIPIALTVGACVFHSPASAQDKSAARKACLPDYQKHCQGVAIGGGRVRKCLSESY